MPELGHSAKNILKKSLPSAGARALSNEYIKKILYQVPELGHSAKNILKINLPSATRYQRKTAVTYGHFWRVHGTRYRKSLPSVCLCRVLGTRRRMALPSARRWHSVKSLALGKESVSRSVWLAVMSIALISLHLRYCCYNQTAPKCSQAA